MSEHARNISQSAVHLLSIDEEFDIDDDPQAHYTEQRLRRVAEYTGPVERLSDDEAEAHLCELLRAFPDRLAPPPRGLPGVSVGYKVEPAAMRLLQIGFDYFVALAERRPRRQINLYEEMREVMERAEADRRRERDEAQALHWRPSPDRSGPMVFQPGIGPQQQERVYFIASESGPIKIGMAIDPVKRLKQLQTSHHEKLTILATCAGGRDQEWNYHQRFAAHRLNGEWFKRSLDILAEVDRLRNPATLVQRERVGMRGAA